MKDSFLENLSDKIWYTEKARFVASRRMKRNRVSSNVALSMISLQIIAINLLVFLPSIEQYSTRITILTIILSGFILVLSLLISLLQYERKEMNYHQCGLELDHLNQSIKLLESFDEPIDQKKRQEFLDEYARILAKYNQNHTTFDYLYACGKMNKFFKFVRWYVFDVNTFYCILVLLIPILSLFLIFRTSFRWGYFIISCS